MIYCSRETNKSNTVKTYEKLFLSITLISRIMLIVLYGLIMTFKFAYYVRLILSFTKFIYIFLIAMTSGVLWFNNPIPKNPNLDPSLKVGSQNLLHFLGPGLKKHLIKSSNLERGTSQLDGHPTVIKYKY